MSAPPAMLSRPTTPAARAAVKETERELARSTWCWNPSGVLPSWRPSEVAAQADWASSAFAANWNDSAAHQR